MNWLASLFVKSKPLPEECAWHKRELDFPVRLIDGGMATEVAFRRWNGDRWEYRKHPEDADRHSTEAW